MGDNSAIEWTDATWNPLTGCDKISPGCAHCYAERMSERLKLMGQPHYARGFELTLHEDAVDVPRRWKRGRRVFVNSMSDLFHVDVPVDFIRRVFATMEACPQHLFQVLTKRADRLDELSSGLPWPANVWQGVSVENRRWTTRIGHLRHTPAKVKFLSVEPLLEAIPGMDLRGIDWVIVGGESGPGCRPMEADWVRDIRDQCRNAGVAFFFKQWGGTNKKKAGRVLDGRTWDELPPAAAEHSAAVARESHPAMPV